MWQAYRTHKMSSVPCFSDVQLLTMLLTYGSITETCGFIRFAACKGITGQLVFNWKQGSKLCCTAKILVSFQIVSGLLKINDGFRV